MANSLVTVLKSSMRLVTDGWREGEREREREGGREEEREREGEGERDRASHPFVCTVPCTYICGSVLVLYICVCADVNVVCVHTFIDAFFVYL